LQRMDSLESRSRAESCVFEGVGRKFGSGAASRCTTAFAHIRRAMWQRPHAALSRERQATTLSPNNHRTTQAAVTVARRVAEERGAQVGGEVGYAVRFEDRSSAATRIKYVTDGTLMRECLEDPMLGKYEVGAVLLL